MLCLICYRNWSVKNIKLWLYWVCMIISCLGAVTPWILGVLSPASHRVFSLLRYLVWLDLTLIQFPYWCDLIGQVWRDLPKLPCYSIITMIAWSAFGILLVWCSLVHYINRLGLIIEDHFTTPGLQNRVQVPQKQNKLLRRVEDELKSLTAWSKKLCFCQIAARWTDCFAKIIIMVMSK